MRVMHIITRMIVGGAQENTLYNCLDLISNFGDEVALVTGPSEGAEGDLLIQNRSLIPDCFQVRYQPWLKRSIHPLHDSFAYRNLRRVIGDWKPDVVHTHSAKGGLLGRMAAWKLNVPAVIHTVHGAPFHPYQNRLSKQFFVLCERWAARRCHQLISVADAMTELLVDAKVAPREKFVTIYSGMDVAPFLNASSHRASRRRELGFNDSDVVFGKIARLFHLKGHEYVIEAASQIMNQVPNAKFLFVGDGILRQSFQSTIERLGMSDRFVFTGLVPPSEIPSYLGAMDVLVHTSLREGLARALPQALLAGIPAISFDIDGAREVVIPGETGYLIPAKDTESLARAMVAMVENPSQRKDWGREGQRRFASQFCHEHMTAQIRRLYERWIERATT